MDGWLEKVDQWGARELEHPDGSAITTTNRGRFRLYMGDPPLFVDVYGTERGAKEGHAEIVADCAEARRLHDHAAWVALNRPRAG